MTDGNLISFARQSQFSDATSKSPPCRKRRDKSGAPVSDRVHKFEFVMPHLHATYMRTQMLERELSAWVPRATAEATHPQGRNLSKRERQILHWVREGKTNHAIGEELGISPLTVKNHVQKILRKLGAANRAQAAVLGMKTQSPAEAAQRDDLIGETMEMIRLQQANLPRRRLRRCRCCSR